MFLKVTPNPFRESAQLMYMLADPGEVGIEILDAAGRQVRRLPSEVAEVGVGSVVWDGCDDEGLRVASGNYFARLKVGDRTVSQRMVILE